MSPYRATALAAVRHLLLLLLVTLPAWAPLMRPGLPNAGVGPAAVLHLHSAEQGERLQFGRIYDRWQGDGPAPLLVARVWRALGADAVTAVKGGAGLAMLALILATAACAGSLAGSRAGILAAALVAYAPVTLSALYQRGEVGVLWAAAGLALAAWGILAARFGLALAAAGAFLATGSLAGAGLMAALVLLPMAAWAQGWRHAAAVAGGAGLGLLLAAPWSRPLLVAGVPERALLHQLIAPAWPWDAGSLDWGVEPGLSLGLPLLGLVLAALWAVPGNPEQPAGKRPARLALLLFVAAGLALVLLALWQPANLAAPWQLLALAAALLAVAAAAAVRFLPGLKQTPLWAALLLLPLLAAGPGLSPQFTAYPIPARPAAILEDGHILLLRLQVTGRPTPGASLAVDADWVALHPPAFDYNVFVHVLDPNGERVAQLDAQPQDGQRPMTTWRAGELISDRYLLQIPADAPPDLRLQLGLYNWQTLERVPVQGGNDAIDLDFQDT